ncbi:uncharacterized protein RJT20DRAFT_124451 [Scheffersomyces xylosifermentans]|uniref:uncharacterized protein n=1 Tax=Scheffersomyces xylosifermentans TaxID=1304137 RepID=UPI00315D1874
MSDYEEEEFSDDLRVSELQSCKLIYPNSKVNFDELSGSIEIPIKNEKGINLHLISEVEPPQIPRVIRTQKIYNLPSVVLNFALPEKYPYEEPIQFELHSSILDNGLLQELDAHLRTIWDNYKDQVLFSIIDYLHERTQDDIEKVIGSKYEVANPEKFQTIVEFDESIRQKEFDNMTFMCEICQEDYKGINCSKFESCGHTFCNTCLFDYFSSVITAGEVEKVHCPSYECTKEFAKMKEKYNDLNSWLKSDTDLHQIIKTMLSPAIPLHFLTKILATGKGTTSTEDMVMRYYNLYKKAQYEEVAKILPNRLVNCARIGCDEMIFREDVTDRLVVCRKCGYAFCNDCKYSYHARYKLCNKTETTGDYSGISIETIEEFKSLPSDSYEKKALNARYGRARMLRAIEEYEMDLLFTAFLKDGVKQCPGCGMYIEKSDGCNKVKCSRCKTSLCFLCGEMLRNSYEHFVDPQSSCYKMLFFGMVDDDNMPIGEEIESEDEA